MSNLQDTLNALLELQQIDTQIQRTQRTQKNLDNGTNAQAEAATLRNTSEEKSKLYHRASGELKDTELQLATLEQKLKNYELKLYQGTVTNPKELGNIEKEIASLGRHRSDLDSRILELMEEVDLERTASETARAQSEGAQTHWQTTVKEFRSKLDSTNLELQELTRKRSESVAAIEDQELLKQYEQLRGRSGGLGIVKINNQNCGGCNMTLPSSTTKALREGHLLQYCENCGRILVK